MLNDYGLGRCKRCRRILLLAHLEHGRCRAGIDCGAHEAMAKAWDEAPPESCPLFARNVEVALNVSVLGLREEDQPEVGVLLEPVREGVSESPAEELF